MVRASEQEQESYRSKLFNFKWRNNDNNAGKQSNSPVSKPGLDEAAAGSQEVEPLTIIHPNKSPLVSRPSADDAALAAAQAREKQLLTGIYLSIFSLLFFDNLKLHMHIYLMLFSLLVFRHGTDERALLQAASGRGQFRWRQRCLLCSRSLKRNHKPCSFRVWRATAFGANACR